MTSPTISIVTTALPHRAAYLHRLIRQAPWIPAYDWIICGPKSHELEEFQLAKLARFIPSDANMGTCRNLCAEAARGEIIVQIDDDDWQSSDRITKQLRALLDAHPSSDRMRPRTPELVGSSWLYCLHAPTATASRLSFWDSPGALPGATLAYWRRAWWRHPFGNVQAEDGPFVAFFEREKTAFDMKDPDLLVYMRHEAHKPEQRDWWREARSREARKTPLERMAERRAHPGRRLMAPPRETDRDRALAHEEKAATVYVRSLMGDDFDRFVELEGPSVVQSEALHETR